jgi:hypothetical protein
MFYSYLTLQLESETFGENRKSQMTRFICASEYETSWYTVFFVKSCSADMRIPSYERHLNKTTYSCLWKRNEITIPTSSNGTVNATKARTWLCVNNSNCGVTRCLLSYSAGSMNTSGRVAPPSALLRTQEIYTDRMLTLLFILRQE